MKQDSHERARQLMVAVRVEEIGPAERQWLQTHLNSCRECANEAAALDAALGALGALPVTASAELVQRSRRAVRQRAEQLETERQRAAPLWIAAAMSVIWMIVTAPYVWRALAWLGRTAGLPDSMWQAGFVVWWFLPATLLALAAAWKYSANEMNWGQQ
jgi:hypothetical protein